MNDNQAAKLRLDAEILDTIEELRAKWGAGYGRDVEARILESALNDVVSATRRDELDRDLAELAREGRW